MISNYWTVAAPWLDAIASEVWRLHQDPESGIDQAMSLWPDMDENIGLGVAAGFRTPQRG